jgi:hypothetical protein
VIGGDRIDKYAISVRPFGAYPAIAARLDRCGRAIRVGGDQSSQNVQMLRNILLTAAAALFQVAAASAPCQLRPAPRSVALDDINRIESPTARTFP